MPYEIHVISNTHWDREWLFDFQETRMQLLELFDALLDILDERPDYRAFLMDAQAVPVEDYLEVRPEQRERLVAHAAAGRIQMGPWYTNPECFSVGGESLVRNLACGHRAAREHGGVMKVGYTPFSYGQNSQMPQIYRGFGIDTMLFYHGVSHDEVPNEFWFEGADGSRVLGSQLSSGARYNFYHNVYRPAKFGRFIDDRMREWADGGCPFHLCDGERFREHHWLLDPKAGFDRETAVACVRKLMEAEKAVSTTRVLAFFMGHDSSAPDTLTLAIIDAAKPHLGEDTIEHATLPEHMAKVKAALPDGLPVLKGERRTPKPMPLIYHLYSDVLSSRTRMKRKNALAETLLQRWAEPFAALAWTLGAPYPRALLDLAWKTLLRGHPHDSIAGSGVDDIEEDMHHRLRQVLNISKGLQRRALAHVQARIDNGGFGPDDVLVTVFNPSPRPREEVVSAVIDLPESVPVNEFGIADAVTGESVLVQGHTRRPHHAIMNQMADATAMMRCQQYAVHFAAGVPALGYATYRIDPKGTFRRAPLIADGNRMENEHLRAVIEPGGTLSVTHKATGAVFTGLNRFEDSGEAGMAWMHMKPGNDRVIDSRGCPVTVSLEENGPLLARFRVEVRMPVPARLDENGGDAWKRLDGVGNDARRTEETVPMTITSIVTLRAGERAVEVETRFDNRARSHRLRALFPTRLDTGVCHVESAFDVVERDIVFGPGSPWAGSAEVTSPMQRFVDVSGGDAGLAIVNDGLREYEVTQGGERAIAITLLRAYEVSLSTVSKRWDIHPEMDLAQCPGAHVFRYRVFPHAGAWEDADVYSEVERLALPLLPAQTGAHAGDLPRRGGFLEVSGDNVVLSALKQADDGEGLVVRVFNPAEAAARASLRFAREVRRAERLTLEELPDGELQPDGPVLHLEIAPKKIVTLRVVPA